MSLIRPYIHTKINYYIYKLLHSYVTKLNMLFIEYYSDNVTIQYSNNTRNINVIRVKSNNEYAF